MDPFSGALVSVDDCMSFSLSVCVSVSFGGMCECICAYSCVSPDGNVLSVCICVAL